jgi:hypothetical protein
MVAELRTAGFVNEEGWLTTPPGDIASTILADTTGFPTFASLTGGQANEVRGQLSVVYADHSFYSDWAHRMLDFFEAQI